MRNRVVFNGLAILSFSLASCASNLVIKDIHSEKQGDNHQVQYSIENTGQEPAGPSTTRIRIGYPGYPVTETRQAEPALGVNQSVTHQAGIVSEESLIRGGCLSVEVCADIDNDVHETFVLGELGNCAQKNVAKHLTRTDLCCATILPTNFDWRSWNGRNWMSPVRDQAQCGSCWAFSAVGAVEAIHNLIFPNATDTPNVNLSEQELVTCSGAGSCLSGFVSRALAYIRDNHVVYENVFPYKSQNCIHEENGQTKCNSQCTSGGGCASPGMCAWTLPTVKTGILRNFYQVDTSQNKVERIKRALVCHGPLSVCSATWAHCLVLVGWDDKQQCWNLKNSWGSGYGNNGYVCIPYSGHKYSDLANEVYFVEGVMHWSQSH